MTAKSFMVPQTLRWPISPPGKKIGLTMKESVVNIPADKFTDGENPLNVIEIKGEFKDDCRTTDTETG